MYAHALVQRMHQRGTYIACNEYRCNTVYKGTEMDDLRGAKGIGWAAALWLLTCLCCCARAVECQTPLLRTPPTLDGRIDPKEWSGCAGFDGFLWEGQLERRRIHAYVGATATYLYIALRSQLPTQGSLLTQVTTDNLKLVYDDSVEVWVDPTPNAERGHAYQLFANASGHTGYALHPRGGEPEQPDWRGDWKVVNGLHDGWWDCEISIPLAALAPGRRADQGVWGINLCRNWKQPWAFSSLGGAAYAPQDLRFTFVRDGAPVVDQRQQTDPISGAIHSVLSIANPTDHPLPLRVEMVLKRDRMPDETRRQELTLSPGQKQEVALQLQDLVSQRCDLQMRVLPREGAAPFYDRKMAWKLGSATYAWKTEKPVVPPVAFQFAYYPSRNRMRLLADVTGLPQDAVLSHLSAVIRKAGKGTPVTTVRFDHFLKGKEEKYVFLPPLEGKYEIAVTAVGRHVPAGEIVKPFERTRYPWENNRLGRSAKVYPPFTPIVVQGQTISTVLRSHQTNSLGLWDQVTAKGQPLLAGPMRFRVTQNGHEVPVRPRTPRTMLQKENRVVLQGGFQAGTVSALVLTSWDYDGTMRLDLNLGQGVSLDGLTLEIPLRDEAAPLLHAIGDGIRNTLYMQVPPGQGVVWSSAKVQTEDLPSRFCSYLFVGSPVRGLCWFAENDQGWSWNRKTPNLDLVRTGKTLTLRVHLINQPTTLEYPRTLTFGLLAAPVKPRLEPWRDRWMRESFTVLGTDINWLALGDCGSVYPAGKDLHLWEMIRRGNTEHLSDAEVEATVREGEKYFAPYGLDYAARYPAHVRYNLRGRYGTKMVFYYNRASYQGADEFQTFQDEWGLSDYRTVGPGNSVNEIKIVPSDSYIDHALYWYGKSFDIGGNQGVYWDNWFFVGSSNTMMTNAYQGTDGAITPSTGLWGMRELSKRTFQYMNERGMVPITMPHMTSTSILPMLSFATVQYDWEWKYSEGDVQGRFPREYIQLVSNGDLAGTWPVLLGEHGALENDPWTQRTFAAVCLVHEMEPNSRLRSVWEPLLAPIYRLLDDKHLQVYRYWDERPQPASTGDPDLPLIVYAVPGKEALIEVTSYADHDSAVTLRMDTKMLGFPNGCQALDAETGKPLPVQDGRLTFPLRRHDLREIRLLPER